VSVDAAALEMPDQFTDWLDLEVEEDQPALPRVRLAFIPSGRWASIMARRNACTKGRAKLVERIEDGSTEDVAADCEKLGRFETQLLQVAGEVVGLSLREIEGREPLQLEGCALLADELEPLVVDGVFWPCYNAIMRAHWLDASTARALFRRRLG